MICLHFFYALFGDYFIHLCVCVCMSDVALKLLDIQHAFSISINRLNSFDFAPLSYIYLLSELFFYVAVCLCERSIFAGLCHSIKFSLNRIWPMSHFSLSHFVYFQHVTKAFKWKLFSDLWKVPLMHHHMWKMHMFFFKNSIA